MVNCWQQCDCCVPWEQLQLWEAYQETLSVSTSSSSLSSTMIDSFRRPGAASRGSSPTTMIMSRNAILYTDIYKLTWSGEVNGHVRVTMVTVLMATHWDSTRLRRSSAYQPGYYKSLHNCSTADSYEDNMISTLPKNYLDLDSNEDLSRGCYEVESLIASRQSRFRLGTVYTALNKDTPRTL